MNKAVFLDRDGVINDGTLYYTYKTEDFHINKGVIEGLILLQNAGFLLIVVTNQGGVAKNVYTLDDIHKVHTFMQQELIKHGIQITDIYTCPHHSDISECQCRKPKPGMLLDAIAKYNINPQLSYMIGDSTRDIEAATAANVTGIKIHKNENIVATCKQIVTNGF